MVLYHVHIHTPTPHINLVHLLEPDLLGPVTGCGRCIEYVRVTDGRDVQDEQVVPVTTNVKSIKRGDSLTT